MDLGISDYFSPSKALITVASLMVLRLFFLPKRSQGFRKDFIENGYGPLTTYSCAAWL